MPRASRDVLGLLAFIILCLMVSGIGGYVTATSVDTWYQTLHKPTFNPPDWVFAPVWTTLYILMGISAWRVWRIGPFAANHRALIVFGAQLGLNLLWSILFFGLQRIDLALIEIGVLLLAITSNMIMFWRIDVLAGALFLPYALWVAYASALNAALWLLNKA